MQTAEQLIKQALTDIERELKQSQAHQMKIMSKDFQELSQVLQLLPTQLANLSKQYTQQRSRYSTVDELSQRMDKISERHTQIENNQKTISIDQENLFQTLLALRTELATLTRLMKNSA